MIEADDATLAVRLLEDAFGVGGSGSPPNQIGKAKEPRCQDRAHQLERQAARPRPVDHHRRQDQGLSDLLGLVSSDQGAGSTGDSGDGGCDDWYQESRAPGL